MFSNIKSFLSPPEALNLFNLKFFLDLINIIILKNFINLLSTNKGISKKIETKILLAYGVYQIEADGLELFEYVKGAIIAKVLIF